MENKKKREFLWFLVIMTMVILGILWLVFFRGLPAGRQGLDKKESQDDFWTEIAETFQQISEKGKSFSKTLGTSRDLMNSYLEADNKKNLSNFQLTNKQIEELKEKILRQAITPKRE